MILGPYGLLLKHHTRFILFGLMTAFASSFGQTYFIGIFDHAIQQDFAMSHTQSGVYLYAGHFVKCPMFANNG